MARDIFPSKVLPSQSPMFGVARANAFVTSGRYAGAAVVGLVRVA